MVFLFSTIYTTNDLFPEVTLAQGSKDIVGNCSWKKFVKHYLGFKMHEAKNIGEIQNSEIFRNMPTYSDGDSIKVLDDVVIVKFSE